MNKIQEPLVREVVDNIIGEYPEGFLGNSQIEENKNFEDVLKGFASVQFIALYYQLKDDKNKNIEYLKDQIDKLTITETRLQQQIEVAVDNPDLSEFEKLHNELIKTKTEKLMTELILKKINPSSEIKNAAAKTKEDLAPPNEQAPQAPRKTNTAAVHSSKDIISPLPVSPRTSKTTSPPVPPRETRAQAARSDLPSVPARANKPAPTQSATDNRSNRPPTRPTQQQAQKTEHRPAPPTPTTPNSTNKTWTLSAEKMEASLKQNEAKSTSTSHPRRKSFEEVGAKLKSEKTAKAKPGALRNKGSNLSKG